LSDDEENLKAIPPTATKGKGKGKGKGKNTAFKKLEQVSVFTICYLYFSFSIDCS
jgi:hypothetical protein